MHSGWKFWIQQRMIHEPSKGQEIIENICPPGIRTLSFAVVDNYRRAFFPNKKWHPPQKKTATTEKMIQSLHMNCLQSIFDSVMILPMHLLMAVAKMLLIFLLLWFDNIKLKSITAVNAIIACESNFLYPDRKIELCFISFFLKRDKLTTFIWNAHRYTKTIPAKKKNKHFWLVQEIHAHNKNTTTMIYHQQQHREMGNLISKLIRQIVVGKYCEQLYIHIVHKKDNSSCHLILWNFIKITRHIYC